MDDNKLLDLIRQAAGREEIPDSLSPDSIQKMLESQSKTDTETTNGTDYAADSEAGLETDIENSPSADTDSDLSQQAEQTPDEDIWQVDGSEPSRDTDTGDSKENRILPFFRKTYKRWIAAAAVIAVAAASGYAGYSYRGHGSGSGGMEDAVLTAREDAAADSESAPVSGAPSSFDAIQPDDSGFGVDSYDTVYQKLKDLTPEESDVYEMAIEGDMILDGSSDSAVKNETMEIPAAAEESAADQSASTGSSWSSTNIQEAGVDEADIIKTDGDYIYILRDNRILIVSAADSDSRIISTVEPENYADSIKEFYIDGGHLSFICGSSETDMTTEDDYYYYPLTTDKTLLYTYDITDRSNPVQKGCVSQNGYYQSSRKTGDYIYLFTQYYPDITNPEQTGNYIPSVNDELISTDDICIPIQASNTDYLVISSVNINDPDKTVDEKAILSAGNSYYVSPENIYVYQQDYTSYDARTVITKFSYSEGETAYRSIVSLPGYINDRFSMNEYNGNLRIVMTTYKPSNALYILDENLKVTGTIQDIANGETIKSARFFGNTGYFVTFRNTDPLFSVDLSDPENPRILGALKVTGFSAYLHFYGENLLLGLGEDMDEDGTYHGIKLSMFDISDPSNVKEADRYTIRDGGYCPALWDPRALMIDPDKNLFGFALDENYMVFSYDEKKGFVSEYVYSYSAENPHSPADQYADTDSMRSCYVNDTLYLASNYTLHVLDMNQDFKEVTSVDLYMGEYEWR